AVPAAPDRGHAVSAQFEAAYGVALRFYTPGLAPREPDVFDYCPISCERGDTLFSVQPVPPSQGDAKLAALRGATQRGPRRSRWRRGLARRWWTVAGAVVLVLGAPYLVRYLGRGIAPPAGGVGFALWMSWETAVATAAMALILAAAALVRGTSEPQRVPWTLPAACVWAAGAALAGLWLWSPYGAWPEW